MAQLAPSALVTERGQRIQLRLEGRYYDVDQGQLREALGLPAGPAGVGITIDRDRFRFEFALDEQVAELSTAQLHRRLARQVRSQRRV
jgi:hypothetical protein